MISGTTSVTSSNAPNARIITIKTVCRSSPRRSLYVSSASRGQKTFKNASNAKRLLRFQKPKNAKNVNYPTIKSAGNMPMISVENAVI